MGTLIANLSIPFTHIRMHCYAAKERSPGEKRTALTPSTGNILVKLGLEVSAERGLGTMSGYLDEAYAKSGVKLISDHAAALGQAGLVLGVRKPNPEAIAAMKPGTILMSHLDPFNEPDLVKALAKAGISAISLEMIPRTTLAQKMDVLSSQANLAGYSAVVQAAARIQKILPMMMTPAGTINPCRVFIIGVGVAGLQAIATAKRLGARVEAFDTRPVVEEQVRSLGAKFVKIDLGETGQTAQGYAKELTPEQLQMQRDGMAKVCATSDIVVTTAKLFGRRAPIVVTREMVAGMQAGSVIVDLAVEGGGNVEGSKLNEEVITENGVIIIGDGCLEGAVSTHASQVFSSNLAAFIEHFWDAEAKTFNLNLEDEIMKGCLITHGGKVVHERFQNLN
ncbi:MAG: NAD(P) transhydrogenase subunit alpha [Opitutaceae bacterium]